MKKEPKIDSLIAARDTYIQREHAVCKEKKSNQSKSFSVNRNVTVNLLLTSQSRQASFGVLHNLVISDLLTELQPLRIRI